MEQRTLNLDGQIIYCYADGSVEYKNNFRLTKTFGFKDKDGYRLVGINKKNYKVHRLIAFAFLPNPNNLPQVDHINRCKYDNKPENLRWCSAKDNMANQDRVIASIQKYGVRRCENPNLYVRHYQNSHVNLTLLQPSGKITHCYFKSVNDELYKLLKPLSMRERYIQYNKLKNEPYFFSLRKKTSTEQLM